MISENDTRTDAHVIIEGSTEKISCGVLVLIHGDGNNPFGEVEKLAFRSIIAEAVEGILLSGQTAELMTLSLE